MKKYSQEIEMNKKRTNLFCFIDFETTGIDPENCYPIQIGVIFTDNQLNQISEFDCFIEYWKNALFEKKEGGWVWQKEFQAAYEVHKIKPETIIKEGLSQNEAVRKLNHKITQLLGKVGEDRAVIVSDNAQFEYRICERLWKTNMGNHWPFHYSPWSVNFLYEWFNPGKPPEKPHDALEDARIMYKQVKEYYDKYAIKAD